MKIVRFSLIDLALASATLPVACGDSSTSPDPNMGTVVVKLTDAPFMTDSVSKVEIYVVRVDARTGTVSDAEADANLDDGTSAGWQTLVSPNSTVNLLTLQNGATTTLGTAALTAGTYNGFRFVIDPTKSSVTLKNGRVLTGTSSPNVTFPSAARSGIKIVLSKPLQIVGGSTTTFLVDFDVNDSFVMRGNSIDKNGLLFKPVIRGSIIDAATVNANVRLANASATALDLLRSGTVVTGGTNLAFGASSACTSVPAATPALTIANTGTTTALAGFTPTLVAGNSYTVVAFPSATGVQFATLQNTFAPTAGQSGLRVFNATSGVTGYDVFVTASGAALGTPTVANAVAGNGTAFVSVPAGSQQIRLTSTGTTTPIVLDLGAQALTAGQNYTLVIAPPASGSTVPRAFLVPAC